MNGLVNSSVVATGSISLSPNWSISLVRTYTKSVYNFDPGCYTNPRPIITLYDCNYAITGTGLTTAYPLTLYLDGVPYPTKLQTTNGFNFTVQTGNTGLTDGCGRTDAASGEWGPPFEVIYGSQVLFQGQDNPTISPSVFSN
jgi:hypothetical protein